MGSDSLLGTPSQRNENLVIMAEDEVPEQVGPSLGRSVPSTSQRPGWMFHAAAAATVAFIVTVLSLVASVFTDPRAPINLWLNAWSPWLMLIEVALILVFGMAAMADDQKRSPPPPPETT